MNMLSDIALDSESSSYFDKLILNLKWAVVEYFMQRTYGGESIETCYRKP
jgi:hypothetical protein